LKYPVGHIRGNRLEGHYETIITRGGGFICGRKILASDIRKELEKVKKKVLYLGTEVESNLHKALEALQDNNIELAHKVKNNDLEIDKTEVGLEDQCLEVLALHQPVAGDLRFLVTALKINIDLERIGDLAVKIADKVLLLSVSQERENIFAEDQVIHKNLNEMAATTTWMLSKSLDAFAQEDAELAFRVIFEDDEVDSAKNMIRSLLEKTMISLPKKNMYLGILLSVSRSLERIADHATNICEDIIYMLEGKIIRHIIDHRDDEHLHVT
jgi:phosphate transport system protein